MSNRVSIQACKFTDYRPDGTVIYELYGYRIHDDYEQDYDNCYDSIQEVFDAITPANVMEFVEENHYDFLDVIQHKGGLYLNGDWIEVGESDDDEESDE
jgi:hypothetical protein